MSRKSVEKVSCVKSEKISKETLYVLLCEWSDVTASYVGRTEQALCNLQKYVNEKYPDIALHMLKLKRKSFFSFLEQNKNGQTLDLFFKILVRHSKIVSDVEVNRFFTIGSSPTLKGFMNTINKKSISQFSFEPGDFSCTPSVYEDVEISEPASQQAIDTRYHLHDDDAPENSTKTPRARTSLSAPLYSVVKKRLNSDEPDIIMSSKSNVYQEDPESPAAPRVVTTPPRPSFRAPSLPGRTMTPSSPNVGPSELQAVAICDYESSDNGVLSFLEGSAAEVVAQSDNGWWCVRLDSRIGWVPGQFWQVEASKSTRISSSAGWFVGNISRDECEELMMQHGNEADFVVRQSANGNLALSVKHDDEIRHFPIRVTSDGRFDIGRYEFKSVGQIVSYYRKNVLFYGGDDGQLPVKLGRPMVIVSPVERA